MVDLFRQVMEGKSRRCSFPAILDGFARENRVGVEIAAAARVMREFSTKVDAGDTANLVDTCGTGGDKAHTFNISTAAAFVTAAAGRAMAAKGVPASSQSGSADVLESLGVNLNLTPDEVGQCIARWAWGSCLPQPSPAMKYAAPVHARSWACAPS